MLALCSNFGNSHSLIDSSGADNVETGHADSWYVWAKDEDLPSGEIITADMQLGDILLLGNLVPHCTTENLSEDVRWSVDLRWQDPTLPSGFEWEVSHPHLIPTSPHPHPHLILASSSPNVVTSQEDPTGTVIANDCVLMQTASDPDLEIDWESFAPGW